MYGAAVVSSSVQSSRLSGENAVAKRLLHGFFMHRCSCVGFEASHSTLPCYSTARRF